MSCCPDNLKRREGEATMKGDPLVLLGTMPKVGDKAPDFSLHKQDLSEAKLADYSGKPLILVSVPSIDTSVCDKETRTFNERAAQIEGTKILTISMDLPFAQDRYCSAKGIEAVELLSDHAKASFGANYGVLIEGLRLLARAVFVVDKGGIIRHTELVNEATEEPDYDAALKAAKEL